MVTGTPHNCLPARFNMQKKKKKEERKKKLFCVEYSRPF
jgi:hypothetical protein